MEQQTKGAGALPWFLDWALVPIIGIVYLLDQMTKYWVESSLCPFRTFPDEGPFRLICSYNTGSAFGLFPDQTIMLILASFIGIGVLLWLYWNHPVPGPWLRISLGLQLGGAIGNLTDRLRFGQVTDFIQLGFWPVFNVADSSIVIGVIILIAVFMFPGRLGGGEKKETAAVGIAREDLPGEMAGEGVQVIPPPATVLPTEGGDDFEGPPERDGS